MPNEKRAILLAAGLGTRLQPLTDILPKCLMPINGRPLLEYWLQNLISAGFNKLLINTHYKPDFFRDYLKNSVFEDKIKLVHEETLLGTAGTLLHNHDFVKGQPVMLLHADNLCNVNVQEFWEAHCHRPKHTLITMMTFVTSDPKTCGIVELDEQNVVQCFYEKVENPPGFLANGAIYIIEPEVIEFIAGQDKRIIDFSTDVLPHFIGKIFTFHNRFIHRDIGSPYSLLDSQQDIGDYPWSIPSPDTWLDLCENKLFLAFNSLAKLYSAMFDFPLFYSKDILAGKISEKIWNNIDSAVVSHSSLDCDIATFARHIRKIAPKVDGMLMFVDHADRTFSAKKIYQEHRVKCFVLCVTDSSIKRRERCLPK